MPDHLPGNGGITDHPPPRKGSAGVAPRHLERDREPLTRQRTRRNRDRLTNHRLHGRRRLRRAARSRRGRDDCRCEHADRQDCPPSGTQVVPSLQRGGDYRRNSGSAVATPQVPKLCHPNTKASQMPGRDARPSGATFLDSRPRLPPRHRGKHRPPSRETGRCAAIRPGQTAPGEASGSAGWVGRHGVLREAETVVQKGRCARVLEPRVGGAGRRQPVESSRQSIEPLLPPCRS